MIRKREEENPLTQTKNNVTDGTVMWSAHEGLGKAAGLLGQRCTVAPFREMLTDPGVHLSSPNSFVGANSGNTRCTTNKRIAKLSDATVIAPTVIISIISLIFMDGVSI